MTTAPLAPAPTRASAFTPPPPHFDFVFDFPTLLAGDRFRIARGSTANGISIGGEARIDLLTPNSTQVWIKAGRFGFNREATFALTQSSPTTVRIAATEPGKEPVVGDADIVSVHTNYSEFASDSDAVRGKAILQLNATGQLVIDIQGGSADRQALAGANLHLVLEKIAPKRTERFASRS